MTASLKHLAKLGIARETTGRNYGRIFAYDKYLKILNEGGAMITQDLGPASRDQAGHNELDATQLVMNIDTVN
ncbi:MAG: hypothetical protein HOP33_23585 [Verrucomicrobia bacterium]|nr:hypothetical protein [Verrucomicrobiota bacterium]